jgi:hypothetical protein
MKSNVHRWSFFRYESPNSIAIFARPKNRLLYEDNLMSRRDRWRLVITNKTCLQSRSIDRHPRSMIDDQRFEVSKE